MTDKVSDKKAPHERRRVTIRELRNARDEMMSDAYLDKLEIKSAAVQQESALKLQGIIIAILRLDNATLTDIKNDLVLNEAALGKATEEMAEALTDLQNTRKVLDTVASTLAIVGRIVTLF